MKVRSVIRRAAPSLLAAAAVTLLVQTHANAQEQTVLGEGFRSVQVTAASPDRIHVVARTTNDVVMHSWTKDGVFQEWEPIAAKVDGDPVVQQRADSEVSIFLRGVSGAISVATISEWSRVNGSDPVYWWLLEGASAAEPSFASWDGTDHLSVFVRGTDGALWLRSRDATRGWSKDWGNWESLDGELGGEPKAVSWGEGRIDVFAPASDGQLLHWAFSGNGWLPPEKFPASLASAPTVVARAPGKLVLLYRGPDSALHWGTYEASGFRDRGAIAGTEGYQGTPQVIIDGKGTLRVFLRSAENQLVTIQNSTGWSKPYGTLQDLAADPAVTWRAPDKLDVFTIDAQGTLTYTKFID